MGRFVPFFWKKQRVKREFLAAEVNKKVYPAGIAELSTPWQTAAGLQASTWNGPWLGTFLWVLAFLCFFFFFFLFVSLVVCFVPCFCGFLSFCSAFWMSLCESFLICHPELVGFCLQSLCPSAPIFHLSNFFLMPRRPSTRLALRSFVELMLQKTKLALLKGLFMASSRTFRYFQT